MNSTPFASDEDLVSTESSTKPSETQPKPAASIAGRLPEPEGCSVEEFLQAHPHMFDDA